MLLIKDAFMNKEEFKKKNFGPSSGKYLSRLEKSGMIQICLFGGVKQKKQIHI